MKKIDRLDLTDSIIFAAVLHICAWFVVMARVGKPIFLAGVVVVILSLYLYLRKGNKHPMRFVLTMAVVHVFAAALLIAMDLLSKVNFWRHLEPYLIMDMVILWVCDLMITQIIRRIKRK